MKYLFFGLSLILFAGCNKFGHVEFTGTAAGIKSGVFVIKNLRDSTLYGENIKDEKIHATGILPKAGYYTMDITDDADKKSYEVHYEVYLEDGKYTIQTAPDKTYKYPKITSSSKIQNELSAYYMLVDQQSADAHQKAQNMAAEVKKKTNSSSAAQYTVLINKLSAAEDKEAAAGFSAYKQFVKEYPQSSISAHLMSKMDYAGKPVEYYDLYKTFGAEAKNSDEGKEIGEKLGHLVKLVTGAKSPVIVGNTPDGKPFDQSSIKRKIILVDFWRAGNQISRTNHQDMLGMINNIKNNDFGIVSISIDSKADWWTGAVKEDKMTWPQVSDLKGDDSKNAANWAVDKIPTYYLVDGNWNIIERDVQLQEVPLIVSRYLKKH
ncbi:MAG: hypothetical protein JWP37_2675 [Mucilaginibacter sp.]|nr:hypothetical protein [Mucilaginibacter sp.]